MNSTIQSAMLFLINTVFDLYLFIIGLRLILVWVGANYFDPITQFTIKLTDFVIKPLRKFIPNIGRIELASLVFMLSVEMVKYLIIAALSFGLPTIIGLLLLSSGDIVNTLLQIFFYAILMQAILSWVQPHNPISRTLSLITSPIIRPLQRYVPIVGGFDITPIPALIILQLLMMLVAAPMMAMGLGAAIG